MKKRIVYLLLVVSSIFFFGCKYKTGYFEKMQLIPHRAWSSHFRPNFTFAIVDTTASYNLYIVVRHTQSYQYNNLWINFTSIAPGSVAETQKLNLKLGDNTQWLGSRMDDIIEHRILVNKNPVRLSSGKYIFMLQNIMREDPLPEIINIGVRVSKAE